MNGQYSLCQSAHIGTKVLAFVLGVQEEALPLWLSTVEEHSPLEVYVSNDF